MTRNLYLGADLTPAIAATTPDELAAADGQILREVVANDFPTRAKGLAKEILARSRTWSACRRSRSGAPSHLPLSASRRPRSATTTCELLLDQLNKGPARATGSSSSRTSSTSKRPADENGVPGDGPLPGLPERRDQRPPDDARRDPRPQRRRRQTWNAQGGQLRHPAGDADPGPAEADRARLDATDAKVRGSDPFHFVNTHLEAFDPPGPAQRPGRRTGRARRSRRRATCRSSSSATSTPTTTPSPGGHPRLQRPARGRAGRAQHRRPARLLPQLDAAAVGAGGSVADFDHQVDHVMTGDPDEVTLKSSIVTGLHPVNGFWDSDHAGLFSALNFDRLGDPGAPSALRRRRCSALAGGVGDEFGDFFGLFAGEDAGRHPARGRAAVDAFVDRVEDAAFELLRSSFSVRRRPGRRRAVRRDWAEVAVGAGRVERVAGAAVGLEQRLALLRGWRRPPRGRWRRRRWSGRPARGSAPRGRRREGRRG